MARLTKVKSLVNEALNYLGYDIGRLHGIEQAIWLSELGITRVLDIGANVGQFSTSIRKTLPEAQIYAFEPIEECFAALSRNLRKDNLVQCFPYALGTEDDSTVLNKNEFTPSSSLLPMTNTQVAEFPHTAKTSATKVEVRRLDSTAPTLDLSGPLLIKMDVQGFELHVIDGGRETLRQASVLIIEVSFVEFYKGQPSFDDLYREIHDLGLSFCGVIGQTHSSRDDRPLFCDMVFVR